MPFFSPCKALVNIVSKEAGTPLPDTFVLPYPLDSRLLFHSRNDSIEKKDDKRVLFAARNDPIKGGDILLHAVPLIREHYQNVQFDFFGYQLAVNEKVPAGVNLHPFVNKSDLIEYYRNADICVIPSLWDNSPNTVYEAMAAGKPVVATKVGGIPELVINEETGLLVEPRDVIGIANALIYLLNKPEECKRMGVNGLERIRKIANLEENVARRLLMYKSIIGT